jgi:hypothetical protein
MQERRKISRKYLAIYSRVFDRVSGRVLGYLSDLTSGGAMIISDSSIVEDQDINLRFDLPDPTLFSADHLNMDAHIRWCRPDIDPAFYNIGFEFKEISPEQAKIIDEMITAYEFRRDGNGPAYPPSPPPAFN